MRLRTYHGTYVVIGPDSELLHLPEPADQDFQSVWSRSPPPVLVPGLIEADITEGPLAPSTLVVQSDGLVAFRRDGMFLCADPKGPELRFDRANAGGWECFAITALNGTFVPQTPTEQISQSPSLSRPVLIETLSGYQIMSDLIDSDMVSVRWPDSLQKNINRYSLMDGSWVVDVDHTTDPDQPFLIYWFYPFSERIHAWRLDRLGRRMFGYDLLDTQARAFLLGRRALGTAFTARLYTLAQKSGEWAALSMLSGDLCAAAEAGSVEALHAVLRYPVCIPPATVRNLSVRAFHILRASNRAHADEVDAHLKRITGDALSEALLRLDPSLAELNRNQLQSEFDFRDVFSDSNLLPSESSPIPTTLHCQTLESLSSLLDSLATYETIAIVLRTKARTVEFHYVYSSGVRHRIMDGLRYAYYVLCTNQSDIWTRLVSLDQEDLAWLIRFEVGDLPSEHGPSVAFEGRVGDVNSALVPDLYYFAFKAFQRGWFAEDVPAWTRKKPRFVWRGSTTGAGGALTVETLSQASRFRLCELGQALGELADFGITDIVQARSEADAQDIRIFLQDRNMLRERMPQHVMGEAKFLVEIDGNSNSWGFLAKLLMGCCILKVDSPYEQWFYKHLQPWIHYVPVANDLSDLSAKVQWCLRNERSSREIAGAGRSLAESLSFDAEMSRAAQTFLSAAWTID